MRRCCWNQHFWYFIFFCLFSSCWEQTQARTISLFTTWPKSSALRHKSCPQLALNFQSHKAYVMLVYLRELMLREGSVLAKIGQIAQEECMGLQSCAVMWSQRMRVRCWGEVKEGECFVTLDRAIRSSRCQRFWDSLILQTDAGCAVTELVLSTQWFLHH